MSDRELYLRIRRSNSSKFWLRTQYEIMNQPVPEYLKEHACSSDTDKRPRSFEFASLYKKHHNITEITDIKDYRKEYIWYRRHGKCRWE